jgi:hypothetical protein
VRYSTGIRRWSKNSASAVIPSWRPPFRRWWSSVRITTRIHGRDRLEKTVKFIAPHPTPSANAAGSEGESPYDALSTKSFNYHFGRWKKALKEQKGKCMVCFVKQSFLYWPILLLGLPHPRHAARLPHICLWWWLTRAPPTTCSRTNRRLFHITPSRDGVCAWAIIPLRL